MLKINAFYASFGWYFGHLMAEAVFMAMLGLAFFLLVPVVRQHSPGVVDAGQVQKHSVNAPRVVSRRPAG